MKPLLLTFGLLLPLGALADSSPKPAPTTTPAAVTLPAIPLAPEASELTKLLQDFLAGASRNDPAMHERFWADDLIYTGSSGRRVGKADILRDVRADVSAPKPEEGTTVYTAEDIRIQQYGTTAIVAFRLVGTTTKEGKTEIAKFLNTGTFLKRNGEWRAVSWQATKLPSDAKANS